jgi:hypothetical protein
MEEQLFKTIDLDSGLKINIYDVSKKMGKDRWLVSMKIQMDIPISKIVWNRSEPSGPSGPSMDDIHKVLGPSVCFEQTIQRVFIAETEKEKLFKQFYDSFMNGSLDYFSHPSFAPNFIIKKYRELNRSSK